MVDCVGQRISTSVRSYLCTTFTDQLLLDRILTALLSPPPWYHLRVNLSRTSLSEAINAWNHEFPITPASDLKSIDSYCSFVIPNALFIPVIGPHPLPLHTTRIFCDKFAAEAVMMGADLFLPGFRGMTHKFRARDAISVFLSPKEVASISKIQGLPTNQKQTFDPASNDTSQCEGIIEHVGNGTAAISSQEFPQHTTGVFVTMNSSRYSLPPYRNCQLYRTGLLSEQTFPASLAITVLMQKLADSFSNHLSSLQIYDICAAPGHKTTALAEWGNFFLKQTVVPPLSEKAWLSIVAIDRSPHRLQALQQDCARLQLSGISMIPAKVEHIQRQYPSMQAGADVVIFDPPCSALGPRPKLYIAHSRDTLEDFPRNQRRLFPYVDALLKSGGYLLYNTCTLPIEENEAMVAEILQKYNYRLVDLDPRYAGLGIPGFSVSDLSENEVRKCVRFLPTDRFGIGYFFALLQKV